MYGLSVVFSPSYSLESRSSRDESECDFDGPATYNLVGVLTTVSQLRRSAQPDLTLPWYPVRGYPPSCWLTTCMFLHYGNANSEFPTDRGYEYYRLKTTSGPSQSNHALLSRLSSHVPTLSLLICFPNCFVSTPPNVSLVIRHCSTLTSPCGTIPLTNLTVLLYVQHHPINSYATNQSLSRQPFDFSFEEEDNIDGMKRLIVDEVNSFRAEVRAQARAAGQVRRQDR